MKEVDIVNLLLDGLWRADWQVSNSIDTFPVITEAEWKVNPLETSRLTISIHNTLYTSK